MQIFDEIERRWGVQVAPEYMALSRNGAFSYDKSSYLMLSELEWIDPPSLLGMNLPDIWRPGFVPFAESHKGDRWCWVTDWQSPAGLGTAFCLQGYSMAEGFAPNFAGAVYRLLLEEFSGSVLAEKTGVPATGLAAIFKRYTKVASTILPGNLSTTLLELSEREVKRIGADDPLQDPNCPLYGVLGREEVLSIVKRDLMFARLDSSIKYTQMPKR